MAENVSMIGYTRVSKADGRQDFPMAALNNWRSP